MIQRFRRNSSEKPLDQIIAAVELEMQKKGVLSDDYPKLLAYLERLSDIKEKSNPDPVSRDTVALIVGNLMVVLTIVAYEQKHVLTSKGWNQLARPKG